MRTSGTVRAHKGRLSALSTLDSTSFLYGAFVWVHRALNLSKRRFLAGVVLTMTGRSADLGSPTFQYDASGTACLDTVADFLAENNPQGLAPGEWAAGARGGGAAEGERAGGSAGH